MFWLILLGLLAAGLLFLYVDVKLLWVSHNEIRLKNLPEAFDGFTIVHIGDLHGMRFGRRNSRLAKKILAQNPDAVIINGDSIDKRLPNPAPAFELCEQLRGRVPVYMALGNHELFIKYQKDPRRAKKYAGLFDAFVAGLRERGATVLINQQVFIRRADDGIALTGLCLDRADLAVHTPAHENAQAFLKKALPPLDRSQVQLFIAHVPSLFPVYAELGPDIVFAGHTHGGVIRLPKIGGLVPPGAYHGGLYKEKGPAGRLCTMHVNRGLGNTMLPIRVFNPPEISVIYLGRDYTKS